MANNRMLLVHLPTGLAAPIAKRMGWGWYVDNERRKRTKDLIHLLFEVLENEYQYNGSQDDFAVALEDADGAKMATSDWRYEERRPDGLLQLIVKPNTAPK